MPFNKDPFTLKDNQQEAALFRRRATVAALFVLAMFGVLVSRYYYLQVVEYEIYSTMSENNRVHLEAISPPRGFIYDRKGVLLADNRPTFTLTINRQQIESVDAMLDRLTPVLELTPEDIKRFRSRLKASRKFEEVPVKLRLTEADIARYSEIKHELQGVNVNVELSRYYPYSDLFAHAIGYVSRISEKEQETLDPVEYAGTNLIGKIGIEKYYEHLLHGRVGYQHVETNAHGKLIRVLKRTPPVRGNDLNLHLDYQLQKIAHDQLAGRRGAVVAIDPRTGGVLAFVSNPSFDPNHFVGGIPYRIYSEYRDHIDRPLYNRALQGIYPPGSTIKPMEALGFLHYNIVDWNWRIADPGFFHLPGDSHQFRDWKKGGHGIVDMHRAIVQSCDTYFYTLSDRMGVDRFHEWMKHFGFGEKTGIDLIDEKRGSLPSVAWKRKRFGAPWYRGEMMSVGIGQGYFTATPLQLAMATAIIANGGQHVRPHLLKTTTGPKKYDAGNHPDYKVPFNGKPEDWGLMRTAMRDVVHGDGGTARATGYKVKGYEMAGKTGTAQVKGIKQGAKYDEKSIDERFWDHGWFIGFAPADNPTIAVAVLVENGKHGSSVAPIAKALFDYELTGVVPEPPAPAAAHEADE
ncbi:MAG: Cell division protein FtsI/penicillin-binding protein 2 [Moraxellaceae bacterium]|jgi:penicillin-binding protein 2|nr:Cell division protein FtsI/penicillin-binding protein 2 [Moraxellaceae bacterium]MDF3030284.1 Cell division protein FtsI/penicillin-binding protein 2 [Moraxellaceae bacterium]